MENNLHRKINTTRKNFSFDIKLSQCGIVQLKIFELRLSQLGHFQLKYLDVKRFDIKLSQIKSSELKLPQLKQPGLTVDSLVASRGGLSLLSIAGKNFLVEKEVIKCTT